MHFAIIGLRHCVIIVSGTNCIVLIHIAISVNCGMKVDIAAKF